MRYGSVCSGIEAASLAFRPMGWEAAFVSEVDPFPSAVLMERWNATRPLRPLDPAEATTPKDRKMRESWKRTIASMREGGTLPNLGDFTQITKDDYNGDIDLLIGGTPCTGFSLAGLRQGLDDPRSNLCLAFARLAYRTDARIVVWENVPGVLSCHGGKDFAGFLSLLCGWEVEVPSGGWKKSGIITPAPGCFGLAWRVIDVQYTRVSAFPRAVPQRRRRVILIGHLDSWEYPAKVLFDGEMCDGDTPPRREARKGTTGDAQTSVGESATIRMRGGCEGGGKGALIGKNLSHTLQTTNDQVIVPEVPQTADGFNFEMFSGECKGVAPTLQQARAADTLVYTIDDVSPTLDAHYPSKLNNQDTNKLVCHKVAMPLETNSESVASEDVIALDGDKIAKAERKGGSAIGINTGGVMYTETTGDVHGVCYPIDIANMEGREKHLSGKGYDEVGTSAYALTQRRCSGVCTPGVVRKLLPVECERLMAMPDGYTQIAWRGKKAEDCPDQPRYKALGNSKGVNVVIWLGERIEKVEKEFYNGRKEI